MDLKVGDVVTFKGSERLMTVHQIIDESEVEVAWFDEEAQLHKCLSLEESLNKVEVAN